MRAFPVTVLSRIFLLSALLSGCFSRGDSLAPIVTLDPPDGAVRPADRLDVLGYALDDEGISSVRVRQTDLLVEGEAGKKLVQFGFRPNVQDSQFAATIVVEDTSGNVTSREYSLQIDAQAPTLEGLEVTQLESGRLRVSGVARDNDLIKTITVAGQSAPFVASEERAFSLDVDPAEDMSIEIEDRAGNVTRQALTP